MEKEEKLAAHQSGHNSGVIHAGIYYTPGSLKAKLCVEGLELTYKYCDEHNVPYKKCGKLIVAIKREELPRLEELYKRGQKNSVKDLKIIGANEIQEYEPNCQGLKALWSPHTGIVDWAEVTRSYGHDFEKLGGKIHLDFYVKAFMTVAESQKQQSTDSHQYPVRILSPHESVRCRYVVACGGLHSDKLARLSGCNSDPQIVPFRGEYLLLKKEKCNLIKGNIYPVPNPKFPFLGVHFTPRIDGNVWLGPNAVLAFKREGYHINDINIPELWEALKYSGFQRLALKNFSYGIQEMYRGLNISAQVDQLRRYVPKLQLSDVTRGPSGVRAQALDKQGNLIDDFIFESGTNEIGNRILHIRNAPSPGATSSLAIAKIVADKVKMTFNL